MRNQYCKSFSIRLKCPICRFDYKYVDNEEYTKGFLGVWCDVCGSPMMSYELYDFCRKNLRDRKG